jgi:hypothetical protein
MAQATTSLASSMNEWDQGRSSVSVERINELAAQVGSSRKPSQPEVQDVLERGFGYLMSLEARLQRIRKQTDRKERPDEPVTPQLLDEIESLRDALTNLRTVSQSDATSWLSRGFVLPSRNPSHRR